jgi:hypothetical protein
MIFAISLRDDNQQCIDKIIDFAPHHLMTKPCRNVCGAQQLMKLAFSTPDVLVMMINSYYFLLVLVIYSILQ